MTPSMKSYSMETADILFPTIRKISGSLISTALTGISHPIPTDTGRRTASYHKEIRDRHRSGYRFCKRRIFLPSLLSVRNTTRAGTTESIADNEKIRF